MKQISDIEKPVAQSGYLLPWNKTDEQPCFILIEDVEFIPLFSTEEKLNEHLNFIKYKFETSTKMITDMDDFLDSISPYRVALDPYTTERFTTRFIEIKKNV